MRGKSAAVYSLQCLLILLDAPAGILKLFDQDLLQLAHSLLHAAPHFLQDTGLLLLSYDGASRVLSGPARQKLPGAVVQQVLALLIVAQRELISSLPPSY